MLDQFEIWLLHRNLRGRFSQIGLFLRRWRHMWRDTGLIFCCRPSWTFSNHDQSEIWLLHRNLRGRFSQIGLFSRRWRHRWREMASDQIGAILGVFRHFVFHSKQIVHNSVNIGVIEPKKNVCTIWHGAPSPSTEISCPRFREISGLRRISDGYDYC